MTVKQTPPLPKFVWASGASNVVSVVLRTWQLCEREVQFRFAKFGPCIGQAQDGNNKFYMGKVEGCAPGYKKGDMQEKERGEIQRTRPKTIPVINLMFQLLLSAPFRPWKIRTMFSDLSPPFITGITSLTLASNLASAAAELTSPCAEFNSLGSLV